MTGVLETAADFDTANPLEDLPGGGAAFETAFKEMSSEVYLGFIDVEEQDSRDNRNSLIDSGSCL